jgi:type II secretory pathway component PulF
MTAVSHSMTTGVPRAAGSFFYVAARAGGGRTMGVRPAASERVLAESLRKEKLLLLRSYRLPAWASKAGGLRLKDRAELNEQLAQLLSRGVPLVEALDVVAQTVAGPAQATVARMRELVSAGSGFADACQRVGGFDRVTIAVYRAAERTGDLAGAAKQLSVTMRRQIAVKSKAVTLMIYPAVVLSISLIVSTFMLTVIVPRIGSAMADMRAKLPVYTQVVMGLGGWMRNNILWVLVGAVVIAMLVVIRRAVIGRGLARVARRMPLLREVILAQESTRFFSVMAAMTRSGVPLADALGVANDAVGLPVLKKQLVTLRTKLIEGGVLRTLIESVTALPLATRRLLIAAERAGDLETAFDSLAIDMADEVDRKATRLLSALEPLLIVFIFVVVGGILMAVMIPMLTLSSRIGT